MSNTTFQAGGREAFQHDLDLAVDDELFYPCPPLERAGPIVIRKRLAIDGEGCTIWSAAGPTVHIEKADVSIRNLRIECTDPDGVALKIDHPNITLEDVTVRGRVEGLAVERGEWRYPHQLNLGALAHGMSHSLKFRVVVPVACKMYSEVSGLTLTPRMLPPGSHEVTLLIERLPRDTLLYGTISIRTTFLRREIAVNAHICVPQVGIPEPATVQDRIVWQAKDWDALQSVVLLPPTPTAPSIPEITIPTVNVPALPRKPVGLTQTGGKIASIFTAKAETVEQSPPPEESAPAMADTPAKPKIKPKPGLPTWVSPPPTTQE
jgi:hypothetical protein